MMEEVAENQWRELCKKIHGKEKVSWIHVAKSFLYTRNNDMWLDNMSKHYMFHAFIRGRRIATERQIKALELRIKSSLELEPWRDCGDNQGYSRSIG